MVIQCTECQTRFKLADDKLKPGGIKVRCAKCKHVFQVLPSAPSAEEAPTAPPLPAPTPEADQSGFAGLATDQVTSDEFSFGDSPSPAEAAAKEDDATFSLGKEEEKPPWDDFSFADTNEAPTAPSPPPSEQEEPSQDFGFDDLLGEDTLSDFDQPSQPASGIDEEDDFDFSTPPKPSTSQDMFDFGSEDESLQFTDLDTANKKSPAWGDLDADPFGDDFDLSDEKDKKEGFDFSEMGFQETPQVDHLGNDDFGSISLQSEPTPEPARPATAMASAPTAAESADRLPRPTPGAPVAAPARSPLKRLVLFVLGLLLTLIGAAGYFLWHAGGIEPLLSRLSGAPPAPVVQPQVRLTNLNGYFVTNKDAGQLFVIQGQAINEYPEARSALTVKGALYDKAGKLLVQQTVFCGNRLDDTALQDYPFAQISEAMNNQFGDSLSNLNVVPGKTIPFTIVFRNFPPELAEFTVESVDSRPGSN